MFRACSPYLTSFCAKASIVVDPWNFSVPEFSRNRRDVQTSPRCSLAKAFTSYSRKDKTFVHVLAEALKQKDVSVWADWNDLRPAVPWQDAINTGIDAADNFVVIISANWAVSNACHEELKQAIAGGKHLVPIKIDDTHSSDIKDPLKSYNFIFLDPTICSETDVAAATVFDHSLDQLLDALTADLDWIGRHTWLLQRAIDWQDHARDPNRLLLGDDLHDAELWQTKGLDQKVQPTPLQLEYILESRKMANRRQKRKFRIAVSVSVVSLGLAVAAVFFAVRAVHEKHLSDSGRFATAALLEKIRNSTLPCSSASRPAVPPTPMRLETPRSRWPRACQTWFASCKAIKTRYGVSLLHPLAISADGQYSLTNFLDKPVLMQQTGSGASRKWTERSFSASSNFFAAAFSPDGKYLAADSRNGLQLWMLPDAHPLPTLREDGTPAGGTPL